MKKNWLIFLFLCCTILPASSQTLFTYGTHKADAKDFLRAFNKNNQQPASGRAHAMREYLDLYINSRLKIQQAYDRGYDSLPQIKIEVENLRSQIIENYMSDPRAIDRLTKEALQRSSKDIHAAHIFIADNIQDTATTKQKLGEVQKRLAKGEDFLSVAQQFSDDPAAKENKGDLNYITVFTLPYEFENIVYATPRGKYSKPYRSKAGYHIFKNLGERKALGEIKIQQILLAFPPNATDTDKKRVAALADSLYQRILAGDDFGKLAASFSNDIMTATANGTVPDISVGRYEPSFEKQIWSLPKNGAVSKPFLSSHGYHIVKRLELKPVDASGKTGMEELKQKVQADDRWKTAKDFIYDNVRTKAGFRKSSYNDAVLWALSDSLLDYKPAGIGRSMNDQSTLFQIGDTAIKVADWITYAQVSRYKPDRTGLRSYNSVMEDFVKQTMYQYYRDHLEDFNEEFRSQMNEFKDGNLFFEIMQHEIWNKAQADSTALLTLYEKNKSQYYWKQSAEAVIFFCSDDATAKLLADQVKKNPGEWKKLTDAFSEKVVADSGRYEWQQIPGMGTTVPRPGLITPVSINSSDNTASFGYILSVYNNPAPRTFNEAKGLVMNDYQALLEEEWMKSLKETYPVTVDQKLLQQISK